MSEIEHLFSEDGPLARALPGFRTRTQQIEMASRVEAAMEQRSVLVVEAGTGTGKTLAYLIPALRSGGKVILSTGTRTLQDQLFHRDLPAARAALASPATVALLKGRANYICHHHLQRSSEEGRFQQRETAHHLQLIRSFAEHSRSGDRAEISGVPEDSPIWPHVVSTREDCLGSDCPQFKDCFVFEARKRAMDADIVVVNHHLFFADVWLREEGVAELLPACNTVIFDEAHQLPETAGLFFGESQSSSQWIALARDTQIGAAIHCKDSPGVTQAARALDKSARDFRLAFREDAQRWNQERLRSDRTAMQALEQCGKALDLFNEQLEPHAPRAPELEQLWQRGLAQAQQLQRWLGATPTDAIRWLEVFSHAVMLNSTPLSVAELFASQLGQHARSWIFTSATLSVRGDFSHYCSQLGLNTAETACWDSPFDYARQSLLYVPAGMPEPNSSGYTAAVIDAALPLLEASGGRAFLLFTSLRAMREATTLLRTRLAERGLDFPLLMQGDAPRGELLTQFRTLAHPVLLGSQSFWEGVDVRGEALSLVVIDRLPFSPPDDPVLAARIEHIRKQGGNPFMDYQLPYAVITLKQGAGRLIRDEADRGVLMICDPRLVDKPYGRRIWQSLPPMRRSREIAEAVAFFSA